MGNLFSLEPWGTADESFDNKSDTVLQSSTPNLKRPQTAVLRYQLRRKVSVRHFCFFATEKPLFCPSRQLFGIIWEAGLDRSAAKTQREMPPGQRRCTITVTQWDASARKQMIRQLGQLDVT